MGQPEMRVCKRCGMEKPITSYNKKDVNKWRTTCKQCEAIARKMRRISEKRITNQNNVESRGTLCWRCKKAVGRCAWTELDSSKKVRFEPVPGWVAVKSPGMPGRKSESYLVLSCPEFDPDERGGVNDAPPKADKPQMGEKLLHARLEMSGDLESLLANLRVLLPDEGQVTVEW